MTTWIDFAVYATWMVLFWFVLPSGMSRTGLVWAVDRNSEWLCAHPDAAARFGDGRLYVWICYALGALSLGALAACQIGFWPQALSAPRFASEHWMVLRDLNNALAICVVTFYLGSTVLFMRALRAVPLAAQRSASLAPRTIDDFVPRRFRIGVYSLMCAHVAAWLATAAWLSYATPQRWWPNVVQFGGAALAFAVTHAVFLLVARVSVNRSPGMLDRLYPAYRMREVRTAFAFNVLPPLSGSLRLYGEITHSAVVARLSHVSLVLTVALLVAWVLPPRNRGASGSEPPSAVTLVDGAVGR